jgi:L-arabinokinase
MTALFYISGHGFGHASREVEVIHALADAALAARRPLRIMIRSAVSPSLLERTLRVDYELRAGLCDTGVVQHTSVSQDDPVTLAAAADFYATFDARADDEAKALAGEDVAVVIADIAPLGLAVADRLGVPGVFIGNFTWDWIYEGQAGFADAAPNVLETIRGAQATASHALRLPFAPAFDGTGLPAPIDLPMVARHPSRSRSETRAAFGLPLDRPLLLLSFGGYGLQSLPLEHSDLAGDWHVVVTDRSVTPGATVPSFVHALSEDALEASAARYEDLVAACDAVVTKPGFGIVGECLTTGTPMLYTSRGRFREYDLLVSEMPRYLRCRFIPQDALFAGRWRDALEALLAQPEPPERLATDGATRAAAHLLTLLK